MYNNDQYLLISVGVYYRTVYIQRFILNEVNCMLLRHIVCDLSPLLGNQVLYLVINIKKKLMCKKLFFFTTACLLKRSHVCVSLFLLLFDFILFVWYKKTLGSGSFVFFLGIIVRTDNEIHLIINNSTIIDIVIRIFWFRWNEH